TAVGIPIAGGHSIDCPEPVYGLAVIGTARAENIRRNADARAGDAVILTKPLGVGIYSAAIKKGVLQGDGYAEMIATTTQLNRIGAKLAQDADIHAMTDVTGFGVLGHGLEMARGSNATLVIEQSKLPLLSSAATLTQQGCVTGASHRNWASYGESVTLPDGVADWERHLMTDPQTSGGLLVACAAERADEILALARAEGYRAATHIGHIEPGPAAVRVIR
ncbi:MAG: selenide, water dikinase SelD, partial [Rhizobiales bacterium]|nr:selenide, water dikinase SelD [Hyphomicrobiales bacterium]